MKGKEEDTVITMSMHTDIVQRISRPTISNTENDQGMRSLGPGRTQFCCITQYQSLRNLTNLLSMSDKMSHSTLALASFCAFCFLKYVCHRLLGMTVKATHIWNQRPPLFVQTDATQELPQSKDLGRLVGGNVN